VWHQEGRGSLKTHPLRLANYERNNTRKAEEMFMKLDPCKIYCSSLSPSKFGRNRTKRRPLYPMTHTLLLSHVECNSLNTGQSINVDRNKTSCTSGNIFISNNLANGEITETNGTESTTIVVLRVSDFL
jgi:hypothetical protein